MKKWPPAGPADSSVFLALPYKGSNGDKLTTVPDELTTLSREAEISLDDNGRYYATVFDAVTG